MKLRTMGSNKTVLELGNGAEVFFSYETPVAAFVPGRGCLKTDTHYSVTTSKHIGIYVRECGAKTISVVPQAELNAMVTQ